MEQQSKREHHEDRFERARGRSAWGHFTHSPFGHGMIVGAVLIASIFAIIDQTREPSWEDRLTNAQSYACSQYPTCVRRAESLVSIVRAPAPPAKYVRSREVEKVVGQNPFSPGADEKGSKRSAMSDDQFAKALAAAEAKLDAEKERRLTKAREE